METSDAKQTGADVACKRQADGYKGGMRRIAVVVHAFAETIPQYAAMLTAQLSSVCIWQPETCQVEFQVWTAETDQLTHRVCAAFKQQLATKWNPATIKVRTLPKKELFRRAIGRNISAKECEADLMWFADADYIFGDMCLDAVASTNFEAIKPHEMVFPGHYWQSTDHAAGDRELERISPGSLFRPDINSYSKRRLKMGIGGLQIVPREVALRGYCDGTEWVKPLKREAGFQDTAEDRVYRGSICSSVPIVVPNLYRIRHTAAAFEPPQDRTRRMSKKRGFRTDTKGGE